MKSSVRVLLFLFLSFASAAYSAVTIDTGGVNFPNGSTIRLGVGVDTRNESSTQVLGMDGYLLILTPSGTLFTFTASGLAPPVLTPFTATLADHLTWHQLVRFQYTSGLNTGTINLLNVPVTAALERGTYYTAFVISTPDPYIVYGSACKRFYVGDSPLGNLSGNFTGAWNNQTFGSTGNASFAITQSGNGAVSITVNLTGNVFGNPAPGQFILTGTTDAQGNIALNLGSPLGFVFGSISASGVFQGTIDVQRLVPTSSIRSVDFSGTFQGVNLNINYTVNFVSGSPAVGTVTTVNGTANSC